MWMICVKCNRWCWLLQNCWLWSWVFRITDHKSASRDQLNSLLIVAFLCCVLLARASLLSGRLPVRNGFYSSQHARNCKQLLASQNVTLPASSVSAWIGDLWWVYPILVCQSHLGPLSLTILPGLGVMSSVRGFSHCWGRKGEFCVAVVPVTRNSGIIF